LERCIRRRLVEIGLAGLTSAKRHAELKLILIDRMDMIYTFGCLQIFSRELKS
jgi:hypothetical protein